jgi:hypothetical protein
MSGSFVRGVELEVVLETCLEEAMLHPVLCHVLALKVTFELVKKVDLPSVPQIQLKKAQALDHKVGDNDYYRRERWCCGEGWPTLKKGGR